jgi:hypothetical protein
MHFTADNFITEDFAHLVMSMASVERGDSVGHGVAGDQAGSYADVLLSEDQCNLDHLWSSGVDFFGQNSTGRVLPSELRTATLTDGSSGGRRVQLLSSMPWNVCFETLYVRRSPPHSFLHSGELVHRYRAWVHAQLDTGKSLPLPLQEPTELLVIQRTGSRRILDLAPLLSCVEKRLRVRVVLLHTLALKEQIRLVHGASALFGVHGSGLTHSLHLPKEGMCLEVSVGKPNGWKNEWGSPNQFFVKMAQVVGISHAYVGTAVYDNCSSSDFSCFHKAGVILDMPERICDQVVQHMRVNARRHAIATPPL